MMPWLRLARLARGSARWGEVRPHCVAAGAGAGAGEHSSDLFDYELPSYLIAQKPITWGESGPSRDDSRLLCVDIGTNALRHGRFSSVGDFLPTGSLLVANNTKVVHARLLMRKRRTGGAVEAMVVPPATEGVDVPSASGGLERGERNKSTWHCMLKGKNLRLGMELIAETEGLVLAGRVVKERSEGGQFAAVEFEWFPATTGQGGGRGSEVSFGNVLEIFGKLPLPPYMKREAEERDLTSYQTVYSASAGSIAAPTAGLHFTKDLLARLAKEREVSLQQITLHTGPGTFVPMQPGSRVRDHTMHTEVFSITAQALRSILPTLVSRDSGSNSNRTKVKCEPPVVAVGTTTVRTLETLYWLGLRLLEEDRGNVSEMSVDDPGEAQKASKWDLGQWEAYRLVSRWHGNDWSHLPPAPVALERLLAELEAEDLKEVLGRTSVMLAPGYRFRVVDHVFTNFHAPKTTLMLLVSAFAADGGDLEKGRARVLRAYEKAVRHEFRFLSYGDACFFCRFEDLPFAEFMGATESLD